MCDRDMIQFVMFSVRMFTFVGASRGHLRDSTAFLLLHFVRICVEFIFAAPAALARRTRLVLAPIVTNTTQQLCSGHMALQPGCCGSVTPPWGPL